ncbi:hypothetical protein O6H91_02G109400 [Diphasiastrum complanatum]|uniref:Uncharacterized protein n=1 Tax=Diphasiastrum complanatum TaxID=34168 RepID=A0ACC2EIY9_DIPCM|nr:hypothetical protein O6H91_02G109400 [Diphasiastrum complanatum]
MVNYEQCGSENIRHVVGCSDAGERYATFLKQSHDIFLENLLERGSYEKLYSYTHLLNGFAVKLKTELQVSMLKAHAFVVSIEKERTFEKLTTHTPEFLGLPTGAWRVAGGPENAGENIVIGILDTGISPSHESFSNQQNNSYKLLRNWRDKCAISWSFPHGSCNGKIVAARYFAKGIMAANAFNASYDFDSPFDGDGHGTHTSSICAGNHGVQVVVDGHEYGAASGIAPRARLAVYKVIYRDGGYLSDVLAGVDQAAQDRVDILSISLGSTSGAYGVPFLSSFDTMLLLAVKSGVLVVHAAGNNGPSSFTMNSFGPWILSVAAGVTDRIYLNQVSLGNGLKLFGSSLAAGTKGQKLYPLIYSVDAFISGSSFDKEYYSYCPDPTAYNATLIKGKILICNFVEYFSGDAVAQLENALATARNTSAAGLLVVSQGVQLIQQRSGLYDPIPFKIPGSFLQDANASMLLLQYYSENTERNADGIVLKFGACASIGDSRSARFTAEAPSVAYYSSRGPVYASTVTSVVADILKPDILAPGNQIWAAWTPGGTDTSAFSGYRFALLSGTSMAAPHVAGIAALLKQKYPHLSASAIRSAIVTTATPVDYRHRLIRAEEPSANPSISTGLASPFDCGHGAVNATAAIDPGLIFDAEFQDYVNFLCLVPGADANAVQDATGGSCQPAKSDRSSDLNMPSITVANLLGTRTVKRTVINVGGEESYSASIHHPAGVAVSVKPRAFTVKDGRSVSFTVTLKAIRANQQFTFGNLMWTGSKGHVIRMPISVSANSVTG